MCHRSLHGPKTTILSCCVNQLHSWLPSPRCFSQTTQIERFHEQKTKEDILAKLWTCKCLIFKTYESQVRKLWQTKIPCCQDTSPNLGLRISAWLEINILRGQLWRLQVASPSTDQSVARVACNLPGKLDNKTSKEWESPTFVMWLMMFPGCSFFSGNCVYKQ